MRQEEIALSVSPSSGIPVSKRQLIDAGSGTVSLVSMGAVFANPSDWDPQGGRGEEKYHNPMG